MYHYVYRITNTKLKKHYYGKRSSKIPPKEDLGVRYFSSSTDKDFKEDQYKNPQNYQYKVVAKTSTAKHALELERKLQVKFQVHLNEAFYNKAIHTSTGFDLTGYKRSAEAIEKTAKTRRGTKHSTETREKMRKAKLGRTLSEEHKKNIGLARKGTSISEEHKKRISKANMKLANVYNYKTNELIASSVCLSHWCENTIYSRKHLSATARYDKTKPTSDSNRRQHKGLYAVYI